MKRREYGFSLIEILIVVTVIGILMAMVLPVYKGIASKGRAVKCQANMKNLYTATMLYTKNKSYFPNAFSYVWMRDDGIIDHRTGWVNWSTLESYTEVYNNLSLGVTHWQGEDEALNSITNGSIWAYTGKSRESYVCPEFKIYLNKNKSIDPDTVFRSYVYNRALNEKNAFKVRRMSATLMFGEGAVDVLTAPGGNDTAEYTDNENEWDGCFMPGSYSGGEFSSGRNNETLGSYHKDGTSHIIFCDGHLEILRKPEDRDVLFNLCEGNIMERDEY